MTESGTESGLFGKIFRGDKIIWCIFFSLCIVSLLEVYSATSTIVYKQQSQFGPIFRHLGFLVGGFAVVLILQRIPSRYYNLLPVLGIPISILLLLATLILGESVNGAQRWLEIGGISIQPSEIAKISAIGFIALVLARTDSTNEKRMFYQMLIVVAILCALIFSENLSTTLLLCIVTFLMMFIGQVKGKRLATLVLVCAGSALLVLGSLTLFEDYLPDRLATWKARIERHSGEDEWVKKADGTYSFKITDDNFQVAHAKIAIAKGGYIGFPGSSVQRDVLPQAYSDFIFAIILEETGWLGGLFVLSLYIMLMIRVVAIASKCNKKYPRYLILGAALMLTLQALVNMAVAVNLIPVTGQPLPLISRGGTSTIITCAYFGIILACSARYNYEHEEVDESVANVDFGIAEEK